MFLIIADAMVKRCGIKIESAHVDGTSLSVEGKYLQSEDEKEVSSASKLEIEDEDSPIPINITHGYSRDNRPDLKQFTLNLLTVGEEGIPLFMLTGDGNKLDQKAFPEMKTAISISMARKTTRSICNGCSFLC
jgi:transposase